MDNRKLFNANVANRRKNVDKLYLLKTIPYLLLPTALLSLIVLVGMYSFVISLFAIYFVLPMFYTADRRIRYAINGIGNKDFSIADGYRAFFKERKGGHFGVIVSLLIAFSLGLLAFLLVSNLSGYICGCFPESDAIYLEAIRIYSDSVNDLSAMAEYLSVHLAELTRPFALGMSIILFLPIFSIFFYTIPQNLSDHYIATIVLPDIDKNISASQARNLSKNGFGRVVYRRKMGENFHFNWPYMVAFTVLYAASTYLVTFIRTDNQYLLPLISMLTPCISIIYGSIMSMFCVENDYLVAEELSMNILPLLPEAMKASIYQAFHNKDYIHGEESMARGSFVPESHQPNGDAQFYEYEPKREDDDSNDSNNNVEENKTDDKPTGVVVDFSDFKDKEE